MSLISGFPRGLLDLLGSQNFGEAPRELGNVVFPVADITDLYLLSKKSVDVVIANPLTNGTNTANSLLVPNGEVWRVDGFSVFASCAAGETVDITPVVTISGGTMAVGPTVPVAANQSRYAAMTLSPFWLPSGSRVQVFASGIAGVPFGSITAMVSKVRG